MNKVYNKYTTSPTLSLLWSSNLVPTSRMTLTIYASKSLAIDPVIGTLTTSTLNSGAYRNVTQTALCAALTSSYAVGQHCRRTLEGLSNLYLCINRQHWAVQAITSYSSQIFSPTRSSSRRFSVASRCPLQQFPRPARYSM